MLNCNTFDYIIELIKRICKLKMFIDITPVNASDKVLLLLFKSTQKTQRHLEFNISSKVINKSVTTCLY